MKSVERRYNVFAQVFKGASFSASPSDQHIIIRGLGNFRQGKPCRFPEAPADAIAHHCIAQLFCAGETDANSQIFWLQTGLDDDTWHGRRWRFGGAEEISPLQQTFHLDNFGAPATGLGAEALAASRAAAADHVAAANSGHTGAEAMAALADKLRRLKSALHCKLRKFVGERADFTRYFVKAGGTRRPSACALRALKCIR